MQPPASTKDTLSLFHPLIRRWFEGKYTRPTDIQVRAWPEIARGGNVLVTAPTGSGKTLTAFLWAINTLVTSPRSDTRRRVLYISPLKALNNDIRKNLDEPLAELKAVFEAAGEPFPEIVVNVRSGDTDADERRSMARRHPDILITTPESLNVMLSSKSGIRQLEGFATVILDEIHAVAPTKRGTYLMSAVERLVPLNGEFQRIALSATVNPLERIAEFVGGYEAAENEGVYRYTKRAVACIRTPSKKDYDVSVVFPEPAVAGGDENEWWKAIAALLTGIIEAGRSTLLFANSRRMVEKIARFINEDSETNRVYSHHGSLAKEIRREVEQRLKDGELAGIVATSSLELGIDVGAVDRVVLIQTPFSVASAVQRIGRAGHSVGMTSQGIFAPVHERELIDSAVLASEVLDDDIETIEPVKKPLDVLAQIILSMTVLEERNANELYHEILASAPYHELDRREFDLVVEMLAGRYADSRIRELKPRIIFDRLQNTIRAHDSARPLLYLSGGVIPDRGYYNLRVAETKAKIGELDEEFVWERSLGDTFPLGNQIWRIVRITHNDVEVAPAQSGVSIVPFWRAEDRNRSFHLSEKIGLFLEEAGTLLGTGGLRENLINVRRLSEHAADALCSYLFRQKEATGVLPDRHTLVIEHFMDPANLTDAKQTVLHTMWGGAVNRPFALALAAAWEERYSYPLETFVNNDCIMLNLPHEFGADDVLSLLTADDIPRLLRSRLESSGLFGAHFRENAQRALLLPRKSFHERMPLWINRLRSKKLLEAVSKYEDFPIILETWRDCMAREFDIENLTRLLGEIEDGSIRIVETVTESPSPFADSIIWRQTNYFMYVDDTPGGKLKTNLSDSLLKDAVFSADLRPSLPDDLIRAFTAKIQRTAPGYAPASPVEILEWIKERLYIPGGEWRQLLVAVERDTGMSEHDAAESITDKLHFLGGRQSPSAVIALENLPLVSDALGIAHDEAAEIRKRLGGTEKSTVENGDPLETFLAQWLAFYGPVHGDFIASTLGIGSDALTEAVESLIEERSLVVDVFREQGPDTREEICDSGNLEILLRMRRALQRPAFEPLDIERLPLFIASMQGLVPPGADIDDLRACLDALIGYPSRAPLWETDILPARLSPYYTSWMDTAFRESGLMWLGCGRERVTFSFPEDRALFIEQEEIPDISGTAAELAGYLAGIEGKTGFERMLGALNHTPDEVAEALWELTWKGIAANDDIAALRKGIMNRFRAEQTPAVSQGRRRSGFNRWKQSRPFTGNWFALEPVEKTRDAIEEDELVRDRIRQLFMRYGILFRELLANEQPMLQWGRIFRTLRLMELSGEVFTGYFFKGIPGIQFCSHAAMRKLHETLPDDALFWMNACDPASLAGIGIDSLRGSLPSRLPGNHIVYRGGAVVLVSKRNGGELLFNVSPDDPVAVECLDFFTTLLSRQFQPLKLVETEIINGEPALTSPYSRALLDFGFTRDYRTLVLRRKY